MSTSYARADSDGVVRTVTVTRLGALVQEDRFSQFPGQPAPVRHGTLGTPSRFPRLLAWQMRRALRRDGYARVSLP